MCCWDDMGDVNRHSKRVGGVASEDSESEREHLWRCAQSECERRRAHRPWRLIAALALRESAARAVQKTRAKPAYAPTEITEFLKTPSQRRPQRGPVMDVNLPRGLRGRRVS